MHTCRIVFLSDLAPTLHSIRIAHLVQDLGGLSIYLGEERQFTDMLTQMCDLERLATANVVYPESHNSPDSPGPGHSVVFTEIWPVGS